MTKEQEKKLKEMSIEELNKMTLSTFNGDYGYLGGEIARDTGQVQGLSKDKEIVQRRTESIRESRKINPLTNYESWREGIANRGEDWKQSIRDARQVQIILQCDMDGKVIKEWPSYKVIQDNTSFTRSTIYNAVKGKKKKGNPNEAYGFLWFSKSK